MPADVRARIGCKAHVPLPSAKLLSLRETRQKIAKLGVRVILQKHRCVQSQRADADSEREHQLLEDPAGLVK
jgi:hypothetical protein